MTAAAIAPKKIVRRRRAAPRAACPLSAIRFETASQPPPWRAAQSWLRAFSHFSRSTTAACESRASGFLAKAAAAILERGPDQPILGLAVEPASARVGYAPPVADEGFVADVDDVVVAERRAAEWPQE